MLQSLTCTASKLANNNKEKLVVFNLRYLDKT